MSGIVLRHGGEIRFVGADFRFVAMARTGRPGGRLLSAMPAAASEVIALVGDVDAAARGWRRSSSRGASSWSFWPRPVALPVRARLRALVERA
jgi:hypothetical protein